ncbi:MAG: gfo/Idh/MocA family oxidoreductase [Planctomycetota bacterium]|nr:MAG: gfo/Idh/MocA family oxidoreductase [Planctomycetota bacterium]
MKVGIIGLGYWGPNLVRNFAALDGVEVAAVADKDTSRVERIRRLYPYAEPFNNGLQLIEQGGVDAVAIATPVATHFDLALAALQNSKHVLVEKPLTDNPSTAEQLCKEAEKRGLVLMVDHVFVYSGPVERLKEIIDAGELGDIVYFDSVRINLGLFRHDVNVVWDLMVHDLSIVDYLFNGAMPKEVQSAGLKLPEFGQECVCYATLRYPNGMLGAIHVSWFAPVKVRRLIVCGTKKMAVYDDLEPVERLKIYERGVDFVEDSHQIYRMLVSYRTGDVWSPAFDTKEPLSKVCSDFVECVRAGSVPRADATAGLRVVRCASFISTLLDRGNVMA